MNFSETPITFVILGITILASFAAFNNKELKSNWLFNPYLVKEHNQWYRAFTHAFIHSDYMHLGFNMYVFFGFGLTLEHTFTDPEEWIKYFPDIAYWGVLKGRIIYTILYVGGFLYAVVPAMRKHSSNPSYNSLGASGAVSAILLAYIVLFPLNTLHLMFIPFPIPAIVMGIGLFIYEAYMNKRGGTGIAHDAHISGAIFGVVFILAVNYKFIGHFISEISSFF
ncbi:MAG: membrane associated rhomboid family serine protease [Flavobacteriales bacterium]|jgi:membrane associated rhomboid family serine protease